MSGPLTLVRLSCPGGLTEFKYVTYTLKKLYVVHRVFGSHRTLRPNPSLLVTTCGDWTDLKSPFGVSKLKKNNIST